MFGISKIALTVLVIAIAIFVMMNSRRNRVAARTRPTPASDRRARDAASAAPKQIQAEDLVRCPRCGVYHASGPVHRCADKV
jgi:hypothetical protein